MALPSSPGVGRPAQGFTSARAQRWVLTAAILTAVIYTFRRIVEPSVLTAPPRGGTTAKLTGSGSPPPSLGHWAVAYGTGFVLLSVLTLGAPEVAASLAMLMVAGSALTNGSSLVADVTGLEGKSTTKTVKAPVTPVAGPGTTHVPAPGAGAQGAASAGESAFSVTLPQSGAV